ncbi:MAG: DUF2254 domain-containing protein [Pyrinomonadaceae bacterium]|nr:DUF2254 domain-containing protein [Pyrinomonadaceae bacterium]
MNKLKKLWLDLNSSLWFLPGLIVAGSIILALGLVELDKNFGGNWINGYPRLFGVEPAGSRDMLSAVAGSMITIAGIVFSIVIVALSLTSTQYTPRILRNFMRDQINQVVLGVFVGIFTYCIVVLRTIRGGDDDQVFVPSIAVITGVLLALVGIGFLIYFIHHIAVSIQASTIIADVFEETIAVVDVLFPHRLGENAPDEELESLQKFSTEADWQTIRSTQTGYIQNIDIEALLDFTKKREVVVKMEHGVGEFVIAGAPLASASGAARNADLKVDKATTEKLNRIYSVDNFRTVDQDVAFGIRQIVDIVMKALSPGVNDTTTAVISIDYLAAICSHLAAHPFPTHFRFAGNRLQVIAKRPSFEDLIDLAFNQTRQNATNNVAIILRSLHALEQIALRIKDGHDLHNKQQNLSAEKRAERLEIVSRHLQMTIDAARENVTSKDDWAQIEEHIEKVLKKLDWENKVSVESKIISA